MQAELKLDKFEGPLNLLLQLIEGQELDITEVALSKVTEQYFEYLNRLEENRPEELSDFLVVAAQLVYLKSRELLPAVPPEEEEGQSLADQLKLYRRYAEASRHLAELWSRREIAYGRIEAPSPQNGFTMPLNAALPDLRLSMAGLLKRLQPARVLPLVTMDKAVSLKEKIIHIFDILKEWRQTTFDRLIKNAASKTDKIVSFLAVLELAKENKITAEQPEAFKQMLITKM